MKMFMEKHVETAVTLPLDVDRPFFSRLPLGIPLDRQIDIL